MPTLWIKNKNEISITAVCVMGVNAKLTSGAFGFFGTGLKYALAVLMRTGHKVTIWSGKNKYKVRCEPEIIRDKTFNVVYIGADRTGFTTDLGKNWEMWQVYREIICNARDEDEYEISETPLPPTHGYTVIQIESPNTIPVPPDCLSDHDGLTSETFHHAHKNADKIFLSTTPLCELKNLSIHEGATNNLYYQGVLVYRNDNPFTKTYNLTGHKTLTEDRTLRNLYCAFSDIEESVCHAPAEIYEQIITATDNYAEADMTLCWHTQVEAVVQKCLDYPTLNKSLRERYTRAKNITTYSQFTPTHLEERLIAKALDLISKIDNGYVHDVTYVDNLGPNVAGLYTKGKIYIARFAFAQGVNFLAGTFYEEYLHKYHALPDESRLLQNYLINKIMSIAESL